MPSFKTAAAVVATALFAVGAQAQDQYVIDPNSVPLDIRSHWCTSQKAACPLLCLQLPGQSATTRANDCDAPTLVYHCICGNGLTPNASQYSQTLPYFICQQYGNQCVTACSGNTDCQNSCRVDHPCGAQNPSPLNTSSSSVMPSTTRGSGGSETTGGVVYNGISGAAETTAAGGAGKKSGGQAALDMGQSYGLAIVFASVFAGFALVL
ncbi:Uncharacterized protein BP5553_08565 [Venustampulla echinocandica]|uniref:DUF7707 domain-containing protein n=1 Tax=Venustampulla echinocandica TaxID=2656787 RepID=A0A370TEL9_9HELO|nr:Uncharacterized protein BP5553_08565 [Venustampulla echinocandica]RDL33126.1 Uncharacterized protein BP5553_08565 [Venustampulla echinocandica]